MVEAMARYLADDQPRRRQKPQQHAHDRRLGRDETNKPKTPQQTKATARASRCPGPITSLASELKVGYKALGW